MSQYRIEFESVSAIRHPEAYYANGLPIRGFDIPEDWWHTTVTPNRDREHAESQFEGLLGLQKSGEHIRNVRVFETVEASMDITVLWMAERT